MYKTRCACSTGMGWMRVSKPQPVPVPVCTCGIDLHGFTNLWYSLGSFQLECLAALACTISAPLAISGPPANASPPGISNWLKISGCQPNIHFPVAEATESIPPECFRHRRDHPLIHATRNSVIPCIYMPWAICQERLSAHPCPMEHCYNPAHYRPSAESTAPIHHGTLSASVIPCVMEHKGGILCVLSI